MLIALSGSFSVDERRAWLAALQTALPEARWCDAQDDEAQAAQYAVVANPAPGSLQRLPKLRFVQSLWAGVDRLLADTTVPAHLPISRMVDPAMNQAMAQTALWATLSLHRGFFAYARQQADRCWKVLPQRRADEVGVTVLGLGEMGRTVTATLLGQGYRVTGWRRSAAADGGSHGIHPPGASHELTSLQGRQALPDALAAADIVINLLPLTPGTRALLDAACFAHMRAGASLVNLARGGHVVDDDLLAALDSGHLAHAVLDVFHTEPLPLAHRFWSHPKVTVLPHAAAQTDARSAALVVAENLRRVHRGERPMHRVERNRGY